MVNSFMDHSNDGYPFYSRDWQDIDCNAISCINNRNKKCLIPSLAIIDDNGKCIGFQIKQRTKK